MSHDRQSKEFLIGAAVGSLLGGVTAFLLAPVSGKELRKEICDTCTSFSDQAAELGEQGAEAVSELKEEASDWLERTGKNAASASQAIHEWIEERTEGGRDVLIGGAIGAAIGVAIGYFLAPKQKKTLRSEIEDVLEDFSERAHDCADRIAVKGKKMAKSTARLSNRWLHFAQEVANDLSEGVHERSEELIGKVRECASSKKAQDVLDWAHVGYRLWQGFFSKRRNQK